MGLNYWCSGTGTVSDEPVALWPEDDAPLRDVRALASGSVVVDREEITATMLRLRHLANAVQGKHVWKAEGIRDTLAGWLASDAPERG